MSIAQHMPETRYVHFPLNMSELSKQDGDTDLGLPDPTLKF